MGLEQLTIIERPCLQLSPELCGGVLMAAGSLPLNSMLVVGMELRVRPGMYLRGYEPTGLEARRPLLLRASHARRWGEFFLVHMAFLADHVHDSEEIVRDVLGITDRTTIHSRGPLTPLTCAPADYQSLEMGTGYCILDEVRRSRNLVYGVDNPQLCLGSLGIGQPLFIAPTTEMMELHTSRLLGEIVPER